MTALKACAHCDADDADYMPDRLMTPGAEPPVFCNGCHASAMDAAAWNRRAPSPVVVGVVEAATAVREMARNYRSAGIYAAWVQEIELALDGPLAAYKQEIKG